MHQAVSIQRFVPSIVVRSIGLPPHKVLTFFEGLSDGTEFFVPIFKIRL